MLGFAQVGALDDGEVFDTSKGKAPISFVVGSGSLIGGFNDAVVGMKIGETKEVRIEAADAYGERDEKATEEVPLERLPEGTEVGAKLSTSTGGTVVVTVGLACSAASHARLHPVPANLI